MRELRNTKIIAVDHGYGNIKTANISFSLLLSRTASRL